MRLLSTALLAAAYEAVAACDRAVLAKAVAFVGQSNR